MKINFLILALLLCSCHQKTQTTNHFSDTYSQGMSNMCPACPPWAKMAIFGGQTVWDYLEDS